MARYYIFFVIVLLLGVACGSLMPRQARPPKVDCPAEPVATIAILCVKGVALRLGPADEIESYDSIHGFRLLILPRNLAQSIFPNGVSSPMVLTSPIPQLGEDALKHQHTSDRQGNIWASVAPGSYLICAITESAAVPGEEAGRCELAMLGEGSLTRLLITHTPSGDRLEFDWPDGRPPVTLISGDAMAPPATIRPIKTPERSSGTTATIPNPPFLPEDPRTKDLRKYVDAWPEERKLVIERDLVVTFTYSHPAITWDQTASLYHVPSMSRVDFNSAGKIAITHYTNQEGRLALERTLTNDSRMKLIRSLIPWD